MNKNLLPHQKEILEWATQKASTSHIVGNGQQATITLPQVITDIRRLGREGYSIYDGRMWRYYAATDLNEAQVSDLEDWLEECKPGKVRN
jgi:hypothetical protein